MKRLLFLLSFLISANCFSQDTLLWENYQYHETILDSSDFVNLPYNSIEILSNPTNDTTYYDILKIILEFHSAKPYYNWAGDDFAICIGNGCAFIPCGIITNPGVNVAVINSMNGKFSWVDGGVTIYGFTPLGAATTAGALVIASRLETSPSVLGGGYMIVKVWYKERIMGSAN